MGRIDAGVDGSLAFEKCVVRIYATCLDLNSPEAQH
jgi:hypothetical protein